MAKPLVTIAYTDPTSSGDSISDGAPTIDATFNKSELYADLQAGPVYINIYVNDKFYSSQLVTGADIDGKNIPILVGNGSDTVTATLSTQQGSATTPPPYSSILGFSNGVTFTDNGLAGVSIQGVNVTTLGGASSGTVFTPAEDNAGFDVKGTLSGSNVAAVNKVVVTIEAPNGGLIQSEVATLNGSGFSAQFPDNLPLPQGAGYKLVVTAYDSAGDSVSTTTIASSSVCFMAGTLIATPEGEVAVEQICPGDSVVVWGGTEVEVVWVGRQTVSRVFGDPLRIIPVRIKAGALGEQLPSRDLLVSPDHALLIEGYLVEAGCMVNGSSIFRDYNVPDMFVYYHIECKDHSFVLAEGVPAETFIDNVDRMSFDNWRDRIGSVSSRTIPELPYARVTSRRQLSRAVVSRLDHQGALSAKAG